MTFADQALRSKFQHGALMNPETAKVDLMINAVNACSSTTSRSASILFLSTWNCAPERNSPLDHTVGLTDAQVRRRSSRLEGAAGAIGESRDQNGTGCSACWSRFRFCVVRSVRL